ncbi:sodium:calcium symporter [Marinoscillum sp.]|uniref:sodium:calcium symporter n=1 Tax=Marinoscillum sp. TaxID=2024838 RepID=UPI003BAA8815
MGSNDQAWGSRIGLILAMAGNSVGLGNFLRFPVQAVTNGGGVFIIPYLTCFLLMGLPLLWVEWSMGRYGGLHKAHASPFILQSIGRKRFWAYFGVFGIFTNIGVAAYYCYIESWTLSYALHSLRGTFSNLSQSEIVTFFEQYISLSTSFFGIPAEALILFIICVGLNGLILSKGLQGVELVAKVGMPLLILFGIVLAVKAVSLGTSAASPDFPNANAWDGLNFLWTPEYDSLWRPKIWFAAAGQIFFTLSVGMGTIHCYAAYLRSNEDITLNASTAGFTNEFIEIVLGSLIVVPLAAGYLGLDWVREHISFGVAFQTMPFLFNQWGTVLSMIAGVMWFGLLFFAGITSSLAMGTPWVSFMRDEYNWSQSKGAASFALLTLVLGLPSVLFYQYGVFDEFDYWAGTVSLVIFALAEVILFAWIWGIDNGWAEINRGGELQLPGGYKWVIKYITPSLLFIVFIGALVTPMDNNWVAAMQSLLDGNGWSLDHSSILSKLVHADIKEQLSLTTDPNQMEVLEKQLHYRNISRILLVGLFVMISWLVFKATKNRELK